MNYSKAIRIARSLADMPQRKLAERVSIDASLISMLESGRRKPTLEVLEKIADALEIPFHLFALLATESEDLSTGDSESVHRLAVGLSKLLLTGGKRGSTGSTITNRKAQHSVRKLPGKYTQNSGRKTA
jgi:transcriptional regulator with XRE-family HTH domain